uniref:Uncharacterized protein n=1 Tax=Romanomermis culicivorax TaxID=13658 RepID=A0A915KL45_ROMCU
MHKKSIEAAATLEKCGDSLGGNDENADDSVDDSDVNDSDSDQAYHRRAKAASKRLAKEDPTMTNSDERRQRMMIADLATAAAVAHNNYAAAAANLTPSDNYFASYANNYNNGQHSRNVNFLHQAAMTTMPNSLIM